MPRQGWTVDHGEPAAVVARRFDSGAASSPVGAAVASPATVTVWSLKGLSYVETTSAKVVLSPTDVSRYHREGRLTV